MSCRLSSPQGRGTKREFRGGKAGKEKEKGFDSGGAGDIVVEVER